jgi:Uma2 family endonuclease
MPVNTRFPPLTVGNYKLLPETGPRYQLIQGDLYLAPAPNRFHQEISRNLQFELHSYLKRNPIGKLFDAPFDVYLDEVNVFQPEINIVLHERLAILTEQGAEGAPELVEKILSPETLRLDLANKKREMRVPELKNSGSSTLNLAPSRSISSLPPGSKRSGRSMKRTTSRRICCQVLTLRQK